MQPRAPITWFGGKGNAKTWLSPLIPHTNKYIEPFGGGGAIFFYRKPSEFEVYNDLDKRLVNLFRVLQDPEKNERLKHKIENTPYARAEFVKSLKGHESENDIEAAWSFYVSQNMGFSGKAHAAGDWGRTFTDCGGKSEVITKWGIRRTFFNHWQQRLSNCRIENRDALEVIQEYDSEDATIYLDPPYVHETRTSSNDYRHEQPLEFHEKLVEVILGCKGAVVLSGYNHKVYKPLCENGWNEHSIKTTCSAAGRIRKSNIRGEGSAPIRIEYVWQNPKAKKILVGKELF